MKLLLALILVHVLLSHSLPSRIRSQDSERPWIRRVRSNPTAPPPSKGGRIVTIFGYNIRVPPFVDTATTSIRNFFVGPSGVITKVKNFLKGNSTVSANFFGRKVDFQANVPLSTEEIGKSFSSFLHKLRTDPMTRVLFAMYLNVVVIIVVFLSLLAKHTQISLHEMRVSREKKELPDPAAATAKRRTKGRRSPITSVQHRKMPSQASSECDVQYPPSAGTTPMVNGGTAEANNSPSSSADKQETRLAMDQPKRRLLNDLSGLLSESSTQLSESSRSGLAVKSPLTSKRDTDVEMDTRPSSSKNSKYFTAPSAEEETESSFETSQYVPTLNKDVEKP